MKLRIRSTGTKETDRIEIPDSSSLTELKALIASKLSSITPLSIELSLNQKDQLSPSSPNDSLKSLGLSSGDLLYYSLTKPQPLTLAPPPKSPNLEAQNEPNSSPIESMDVDTEKAKPKPSPFIDFLKMVLDLEEKEVKDNLGFAVVAVHAIFLESGFVVCSGDGTRLPKDWNLATPVSIQYTVPELLGETNAKVATVKFSAIGNSVSVYGLLQGDSDGSSCIYQLRLDLTMVLPLVVCMSDSMNEEEEEEKGVVELWRTVKKELCSPLLADIYLKNGLLPPPLPLPCISGQSHEPMELEKAGACTPYFLKRVMELEREEVKGKLGFLVVSVHAVFLEAGFVVSNGEAGSHQLPKDWNSGHPTISVRYTVPDLLDQIAEGAVEVATVRFSVMGKMVSVYGFLSDGSSGIYKLCLDMSKLVPLLVSWSDWVRGGDEEKVVFEFWKAVKDVLCLPLMVDICEKNGLALPPCFARLPTDLKYKILECLSGKDLARMGCTGREMRYLALNEELWKQKYMNEIATKGDERGLGGTISWRAKYRLEKVTDKYIRAQVAADSRRYKRRPLPLYPSPFGFGPPRLPFGFTNYASTNNNDLYSGLVAPPPRRDFSRHILHLGDHDDVDIS